jgi:hypothetical protein
MRGRRILWLAVVLSLLWPVTLVAGEHVRVVLDVSGSMTDNDPRRRVILATVLLHDLAAPNPTLDDSFEILPFDQNWRWESPQDPPPRSTRGRIRARFERRDELIRELGRLGYDARMTYFYPGIKAAIADLRETPGGHRDVRTIVLVTDGVPEPPTREREAELIRTELVPELERHGIRLYVLAFSDQALQNRDFLDAMVRSGNGARLGEVFLDPDGSGLLSHMVDIFARSFGYAPDAPRDLPGPISLDLEKGGRPERVAVVVHAPRPEPPELRLTPPQGGFLNAPDGVVSAGEEGGSYSLVWALSPSTGEYRFASSARDGSVAVLRPVRLELEVLPAPPHTQTELTMARTPFRLRVRVRSPLEDVGDPGPVDLSFRPLGERSKNPGTGEALYSWRGERGAPPAGPGEGTPDGRIYDVEVEFPENRRQPGEVYVGYLELEARRGEAIVGARVDEHAHRVEVHPFLALAPLPLTAYVSDRALERHEQSCTSFSLTLNGELPHPGEPEYALRAVLDPPDGQVFERELWQALFTLDGIPLTVQGRSGAEAGAWHKGRTLDRDQLLGEHELCLKVGEPRGHLDEPFEIPLAFTLLEAPYDDFRVVTPFTAKVRVAPPGTIDRLRPLIVLGSLALALLAALWYLRERPGLPRDLRCALGRDPAALVSCEPGSPPLLRQLLGLTGERPLVADGGEALAWLRPAGEELYRLRPAPGMRIRSEDGRPVLVDRGLANVEVHRPYRLEGERGSHVLRLEYS